MGQAVTGSIYCVFRPCAGCGLSTLTMLDVARDHPEAALVFVHPPEFALCTDCSALTRSTFPA